MSYRSVIVSVTYAYLVIEFPPPSNWDRSWGSVAGKRLRTPAWFNNMSVLSMSY